MFNENQYYEPDKQYTDVNELIDDDKNVSTCDLAGGKTNILLMKLILTYILEVVMVVRI